MNNIYVYLLSSKKKGVKNILYHLNLMMITLPIH